MKKRALSLVLAVAGVWAMAMGDGRVMEKRALEGWEGAWPPTAGLESRATETKQFTYASTPMYGMYVVATGKEYAGAMKLDKATAMKFKGDRITKVILVKGINMGGETVEVFVSKSDQDLTNSVTTTLSDASTQTITLAQPVEIDGSTDILVGFRGTQGADQYPLIFDGIANENDNSFLAGTKTESGGWKWASYASEGAICVTIEIEGENFPMDEGTITLTEARSLELGKESAIGFSVRNGGFNAIKSFEAEMSLNGGGAVKKSYTANIGSLNATQDFTMGYTPEETGVNLPLKVKLVSVNGKPQDDGAEVYTMVNSFPASGGYKKKMVVEEGTATWCGFCPRGIVGMETMKENHSDGSFIPLAVHSDDEMAVSGYSARVSSLPGAKINRLNWIGEADPSAGKLEYYYGKVTAEPAVADVAMEVTAGDDAKTFVFKAETTFMMDVNGEDFRLAFAVTEDNVGPYKQTNYYAGGTEQVGGWEKKGSKVMTWYNDVARGISGYYGVEGSLGRGAISKGEPVKYEYKQRFEAVNDAENCHFVCMVVNQKTGEIENAVMTDKLSTESGVSGLEGSVQEVRATAGGLAYHLDGECTIGVYDLRGRLLKEERVNGAGVMETGDLARGVYVYKVSGAHTTTGKMTR